MNSSSVSTIKSTFDQDGYIHYTGFFSEDEIRAIQENLEDYIEKVVPTLPPELAFYEDASDKTSLKQMFGMSDHHPFFESLLYGGKAQQLAEELLGEQVSKGAVEYFNKPPSIGKATPPHQDAYYFMLTPPSSLTFWIPLERVDEENGCLRYVKGSHLLPMRPHGRSQILGFSQGIVDFGTAEDQANEVAVPAEVGDALVHHGMTIHRADPNQSKTRSRTVLGLVYFGVSAKEDLVAKAAYQEKLKKETLGKN